jgi:hypothetical protein
LALEAHLHGHNRISILYFQLDQFRSTFFSIQAHKGDGMKAGVALLGQKVAGVVLIEALVPAIENHPCSLGTGALKEFHIAPLSWVSDFIGIC